MKMAGFEYVKSRIINYKLNVCCFRTPIRFGLLIISYINIFLAYTSLIGIADESFKPILVQVQEQILGDNATKPIPILASATELSSNVLLLCAIYRNDITLMRAYMLYCIGAVVMSVLVYSMVVAAIGAIMAVVLVLSIIVQLYVLLLVRSLIVEMKLAKKNLELPTLIYSTPILETKEQSKPEDDTPVTQEPDTGLKIQEISLETVNENPKDENTNEKD